MRKIVKTSHGWLDIDMATSGWHDATRYGQDGWEDEGAVWNETYGADRGKAALGQRSAPACSSWAHAVRCDHAGDAEDDHSQRDRTPPVLPERG